MTAPVRKGDFIRSVTYDNGGHKAFAAKLSAAMLGRNITSRQLALRSGVADPTIKIMSSTAQSDRHNQHVSLYVLVGLADGLGIGAAEVISWATTRIIAEPHIIEARSTAMKRAARYRARADAQMRAEVLVPPMPPTVPSVPLVKPQPPAISLASVMMKLRSLKDEDLVLIDELITELI